MSQLVLGQVELSVDVLFDSLPVPAALIDRSGLIVAVNNPMVVQSEQLAADYVGRDLGHFDPILGRNFSRDLARLDQGATIPPHELEVQGRVYLIGVRPIRHPSLGVLGVLVSLTDINRQKQVEQELARANKFLAESARRDFSTQLWNRRYLDEALVHYGRTSLLSAVLLDIDHFKAFNDTYGHLAGDECLRTVASLAQSASKRVTDHVCRYGGEEFVVLLPDTPLAGAVRVAESIRHAVEHVAVPHAGSPFGIVTVSLGVAEAAPGANSGTLVLAEADSALYRAKTQGRNRLVTSGSKAA